MKNTSTLKKLRRTGRVFLSILFASLFASSTIFSVDTRASLKRKRNQTRTEEVPLNEVLRNPRENASSLRFDNEDQNQEAQDQANQVDQDQQPTKKFKARVCSDKTFAEEQVEKENQKNLEELIQFLEQNYNPSARTIPQNTLIRLMNAYNENPENFDSCYVDIMGTRGEGSFQRIPVLEQSNNDCGYHALFNSMGVSVDSTDKLLKQSVLQSFLKLAKQKIMGKREADKKKAEKSSETAELGLADDSIPSDDQNLSGGDIEFLQRDADIINFFQTNFNVSNETIDEVKVIEFPDENEMEVDGQESVSQGRLDGIRQTINKFKDDKNKQTTVWIIRFSNHWAAVKVEKEKKDNPLYFSVADSMQLFTAKKKCLQKIKAIYCGEQYESQEEIFLNSASTNDFAELLNNALEEQVRTRNQSYSDADRVSHDKEKEVIERAFQQLISKYDEKYPETELKKLYSDDPGKAIGLLLSILNKENKNDTDKEAKINLSELNRGFVVPVDEYENYKFTILLVYHDRTIEGLKLGFKRASSLIKDFFVEYLQDVCSDEKQKEQEARFFEEHKKRREHKVTNKEKVLANNVFDYLMKKYSSSGDKKKHLGVVDAKRRFNKNPEDFVCMFLKSEEECDSLIKELKEAKDGQSIDFSKSVVLYDKKVYSRLFAGEKDCGPGALLIGVDLRCLKLNDLSLMHAILIDANFKGNKRLQNISFQYSDLSFALFDDVKAIMLFFNNSNLISTSFVGAYIGNSNFNLAKLVNNSFDHCWLYRCKFAGEHGIKNFSFKYSKIQECRFGGIEFYNGSFFNAVIFLSTVSSGDKYIFYNCLFKKVDFTASKFKGIYFENCFFASPWGWTDFSYPGVGSVGIDLTVSGVAAGCGICLYHIGSVEFIKKLIREGIRNTPHIIAEASNATGFWMALVPYVATAVLVVSLSYEGYRLGKKGKDFWVRWRDCCTGLGDFSIIDDCSIYNSYLRMPFYDSSGLTPGVRENLRELGVNVCASEENALEICRNIITQVPYSVLSGLARTVFGVL